MVENFGKTVRSVVKRFDPDAGARMSINHYATKLIKDFYLPSDNATSLELSHSLDDLYKNKNLTNQERADILKVINKITTRAILNNKKTADISANLPIMIKVAMAIVSTKNQSIQQSSSEPIENFFLESSAGISTLTEKQGNEINDFQENLKQQSSVAQSAKQVPTKKLPPIPPKKSQQLQPKTNTINQETMQVNTRLVTQSPEQTHTAPTKQLPKIPTSSVPQTSTQSAVEENKTTETTSTSHSEPQKTSTSLLKRIKSKLSPGRNKPIETDTISQDPEPTPITQATQNQLDKLLKQLDDLPKSEKVTELANQLTIARNSDFEETAKVMIDLIQKELEKIPIEETPKINNESPTDQPQDLTEMIKNGLKNITKTTENNQDNNEISLNDLETKISNLDPTNNNFYGSFLEIVGEMEEWLEDNIMKDDENYHNIKNKIHHVLSQKTNDEILKALKNTFEILKNPNEQNLDQGQSK